jgi:hypothetical protein
MLSMAIATATVIFSVVDAVLLRSLPFHDSESVVLLQNRNTAGRSVGEISLLDLREWRRQTAVSPIDVLTSVNRTYRVSADRSSMSPPK